MVAVYLHLAPAIFFPSDVKTWTLCTGAELNLRERVLGEVENNNFIASSGKGECRGPIPSKLCVLIWGKGVDLVRSFIAMVQGQVASKDPGVCGVCIPLIRP